jgi:hypothetical protein
MTFHVPEWTPLLHASKWAIHQTPTDGCHQLALDVDVSSTGGARMVMSVTGEGAEVAKCFVKGIGAATAMAPTRTFLQRLADASTTHFVNAIFNKENIDLDQYVAKFVSCVEAHLAPFRKSFGVETDDITLIYKGGNVLVAYLRQLIIVEDVKDVVKVPDMLANLNKLSDTDFSVHFATTQLWREHHDAVSRIVVCALHDFRDWLASRHAKNIRAIRFSTDDYASIVPATCHVVHATPTRRSDFVVLSSQDKDAPATQAIIYGNRHNSRRSVTNAVACDLIVAPLDSLVMRQTRGAPDTRRTRSNDNDPLHSMYVTFNNTIRFAKKDMQCEFDLLRLKYNVDVELQWEDRNIAPCTYHAPSELIDVSISTQKDFKTRHVIGKPIDSWTTTVPMKCGTQDVQVRVPTLEYLVNHDLHAILFVESDFPWEDQKYLKRMQRYLLGSVILAINADIAPTPNHLTLRTITGSDVKPSTMNTSLDALCEQMKLMRLRAHALSRTPTRAAQAERYVRAVAQVASIHRDMTGVRDRVMYSTDHDQIQAFDAMIDDAVRFLTMLRNHLALLAVVRATDIMHNVARAHSTRTRTSPENTTRTSTRWSRPTRGTTRPV